MTTSTSGRCIRSALASAALLWLVGCGGSADGSQGAGAVPEPTASTTGAVETSEAVDTVLDLTGVQFDVRRDPG